MAIINFPAGLEPNTASWEFDPNTRAFQSSFNGYSQVIQGLGARYKASFNYTNLTQDRLRLLSYLDSLPRGTVFAVPAYGFQYGGEDNSNPNTVVVSGAGQTGSTINTAGWDNNKLVLKMGDKIAINGELKTIAENSISNGSGVAVIKLTAPLRKPAVSGAKVTYNPAIVNMRITPDQNTSLSMSQGSIASGILTAASLGLEEVIY